MTTKGNTVIPFMKCFTGLVGAFTPEEVIFMLYMADRTRLREKRLRHLAQQAVLHGEHGDGFADFRQVRGKDNAYGIA